MRAFTVCVPTRSTHKHWDELAESVQWALQQLGHEAHRGEAVVARTQPIYLGLPVGPAEPDAIFYNTEQVDGSSGWATNRLSELYKDRLVWDYSLANAQRYPDWGLPRPAVVRPGFCPILQNRIPHQKDKTYDVAFFGWINDRRAQALRAIGEHLTLLQIPLGTYGAARDVLLGQAKICINIHFYETKIFESVRCSYLALNRLPVLSEDSAGGESNLFAMSGVPYEQLVIAACALCADAAALDVLREQQQEAVGAISMVDQIGAALERSAPQKTYSEVPMNTNPEIVRQLSGLPVLGAMRIKNESMWIRDSIESQLFICDKVIVLDDHSTDDTREIVRSFGDRCVLIESPFEGVNEARDKQLVLEHLLAANPEWVLWIDGDEVLEAVAPMMLRSELTNPLATWYSMRVLYFWDALDRIRVDGCYANFQRTSLFRVRGQDRQRLRFQVVDDGANLHCCNYPRGLTGNGYVSGAQIKHYGYLDRQQRQRKFEWYNKIDPNNEAEDCYRHIIETPGAKHAPGPTVLEAWAELAPP